MLYLVGPGGSTRSQGLEQFDRGTGMRTTYPEFRPDATDLVTTASGSLVAAAGVGGSATVFDLQRRTLDVVPTASVSVAG